jgi:hypothetical protein
MDTWGITSEEAFAIRKEQEKELAEQEKLDNEAYNRAIVTTAFVNAEPAIVDYLSSILITNGYAKVVAWQILDLMTKH